MGSLSIYAILTKLPLYGEYLAERVQQSMRLRTQIRQKQNFKREGFKMVSKAKKTTALLLAALMCAGAFAGCGGSSTSSESSTASKSYGNNSTTTSTAARPTKDAMIEQIKKEASSNGNKVELKIWTPSGDKKFVKSALEDFKKDYAADGVEYSFTFRDMGENDAVAALVKDPSKGADVFQFATDQLLEGVQSKAIAEVPTILQTQIKEDNMEQAIKDASVKEKIYAYPMTSDNGYILFYDKATFTEDDVKSFEGLLDKAKEKKATVLMSLDDAWYNAAFFYAAGCDIKLDTSTNKMDLVDFDTDKGVSAVKAMKSLVDTYKDVSFIPSGDNAAISTYLSDGKLKAVVTGTWNTNALKDTWGADNVGAAKLPTVKMNDKDTQLHSFGGYKLVGVNAQSKYPITSAIVASYLTGEKVQESRYDNRSLIPTNNKVREMDKVKNNPITKAIDEQKAFSHSQANCTQAFWDPIASIGTDVNNKNYNSDADIKAALEKQVKSVENN